jgi:hypothetical protein
MNIYIENDFFLTNLFYTLRQIYYIAAFEMTTNSIIYLHSNRITFNQLMDLKSIVVYFYFTSC